MQLLRIGALLAGATLLVTGVVACGGDDDDSGDDGGGPAATTPAATTPAQNGGAVTPVQGATETFVEVDAADFSFNPTAVAVPSGKELTFAIANTGAVPHTFTVYASEDYTDPVEGADTENIPDGTVGEFKVALTAGDYFFRCENHPSQMEGTITAQ